MRKQQVVFIHGGTTFNSHNDYIDYLVSLDIDLDYYRKKGEWKYSLVSNLGDDFDVLILKMPNPTNAKYEEWKIVFDKISKLLDDNVILVGYSMGGIFLAKYLSENKFPKQILASILISAPYEERDLKGVLGDFSLVKSLSFFNEQSQKILLYQSKDDPVVNYLEVYKYKKELPKAVVREFEDKGHFSQGKLVEFPELVEDIRKISGLYA